MKMKRHRVSNFTVDETDLLLKICLKKKKIIENKLTNKVTNQLKAKAWQQVYDEFNTCTKGEERSLKSLQMRYDHIKKDLRKYSVETAKVDSNNVTVIGSSPPSKPKNMTENELDLFYTIQLNAVGLNNFYESDTLSSDTGMSVQPIEDDLEDDTLVEPEEYIIDVSGCCKKSNWSTPELTVNSPCTSNDKVKLVDTPPYIPKKIFCKKTGQNQIFVDVAESWVKESTETLKIERDYKIKLYDEQISNEKLKNELLIVKIEKEKLMVAEEKLKIKLLEKDLVQRK